MKQIKEVIKRSTIINILVDLFLILLYIFIIKVIWKSNYEFVDFIYTFVIVILVCKCRKNETRLKAIEIILDQGVNNEEDSKN